MFHQRSIARALRSASRWGSICRRLRSAAIALIPADTFHPLRRSPPRSIKLHGLEAKLAFAHALALDNDDNMTTTTLTTPWSSHTPTRTAQFSSPAIRSTQAVVCPAANQLRNILHLLLRKHQHRRLGWASGPFYGTLDYKWPLIGRLLASLIDRACAHPSRSW